MPDSPTVEQWRKFRHGPRPQIDPEKIPGSAWDFSMDIVPYIKYFDGRERERFLELSQQEQTRELLLQNLETIFILGAGEIGKGVKAVGGRYVSPVFRRWFPKATKNVEKVAKSAPNIDKDLPKYAGSVNLERQAIPRELKLAEMRAAEGVPKKSVTWAETDAKSAKVIRDPKELAKTLEKAKQKPGELNLVEEDVIRKANVEGVYQYQQRMMAAKTPAEKQALFHQYRDELFRPASDVASASGRSLQAYNKEIGLNRVGKAFSKLKKSLNERQAKEFLDLDLNDADAVSRFAKRLPDPKAMEYVYEFWYNSVLSGVPTHVVNVASNTGWRMFQIPHRGLTGALDLAISKFTGRQQEVFIREMIPLWSGMATGKKKAAGRAWNMLRYGQVTEAESKWALEMGSTLGAFDRSGSRIVRGAGKAITVPTKALRAMDVYANSIAYDGQMKALAHRAAFQKKLHGSARKEFVKRFVENPSPSAHRKAMEFAKYSTFMSDPGKFSSWIIRGRDVTPGGRFVVPFVNTIGNLMKRGVEMTPLVGTVLAKGQKPAEVLAKQIEGAVIAALMYHKMESGEITTAAPRGEAARDAFYRQGKKSWAMKIGDNWYQYRRIEPFNTVIASTAIFHKRIKEALAEGDEEGATKAFGNMVNDFKNNLIDSSYLQGVSKVINRHGQAQSAIPQLAASMVPYSGFWRSINRAYEAYHEGGAKVYDHRDMMAAFGGVIPGLYKLREPKLNVWGEEVELPGNVLAQWVPYKFAPATQDKTELFLEELGYTPGLPNQRVDFGTVKAKLDDDIYRQMVVDGGVKIKKWLDSKVQIPVWQKRLKTDKGKERLIQRIKEKRGYYLYKARRRAIKEQRKRGTIQE
jgi:hypothetical protein